MIRDRRRHQHVGVTGPGAAVLRNGRYISSGMARSAVRARSAAARPVPRAMAARAPLPLPRSAARKRWNDSLCSRNGERSSSFSRERGTRGRPARAPGSVPATRGPPRTRRPGCRQARRGRCRAGGRNRRALPPAGRAPWCVMYSDTYRLLVGLSAQLEESWSTDRRPIRASGISIPHAARPETIDGMQRIGGIDRPTLMRLLGAALR